MEKLDREKVKQALKTVALESEKSSLNDLVGHAKNLVKHFDDFYKNLSS